MQMTRSKWFMPGCALALGFVLAAEWAGGDLSQIDFTRPPWPGSS
jgi:hypothetical protein